MAYSALRRVVANPNTYKNPATRPTGVKDTVATTTAATRPTPTVSTAQTTSMARPNVSGPKISKPRVTSPSYQPGQTVDLQALRDRVNNQSKFTPVDTIQTQFQTPSGVSNYAQEIQKSLQPMYQQQVDQINSTAREGMGSLLRNLNRQGNMESGVTLDQARMAEASRARQLQDALASMQSNAINLGLQYGNLGLQEGQAKFNEGMANQQMISSEDQRAIDNLRQALGMDVQQNQWSQEFGLNRQNSDRDWSLQKANLGLQTDQANRAAYQDDRNFNYGAGQDAIKNALAQQQFGEQQRQFNIDAASQLSNLFGKGVQPKGSGFNLFAQVAGQPTQAATNANRDWQTALAQLATQQQNNANDNALGWANYGLNQQKFNYDMQNDSARNISGLASAAAKQVDSLTVGQWQNVYNKDTGEYEKKLVQVPMATQLKTQVKSGVNELLQALAQESDPVSVLNASQEQIKQTYGAAAPYIMNILSGSVGSLGK